MAQTKPKRLPDETPIIGARILLIESRFHEEIADELVAGALARLEMARVKFDPIAVPGALEIPVAAAISLEAAGNAGLPYDGIVALGCVIRGETTHYDYVCGESARGLQDLVLQHRAAIGFGILTVENEAQALARARVDQKNKGGEAARACLAMIALRRQFGLEPA